LALSGFACLTSSAQALVREDQAACPAAKMFFAAFTSAFSAWPQARQMKLLWVALLPLSVWLQAQQRWLVNAGFTAMA